MGGGGGWGVDLVPVHPSSSSYYFVSRRRLLSTIRTGNEGRLGESESTELVRCFVVVCSTVVMALE